MQEECVKACRREQEVVVGRSLGEGGRLGTILGSRRSSGSQKALSVCACLDNQVGTEACEVRQGGDHYREHLFCLMVMQVLAFLAPVVFLGFGHLFKDLMEIVSLQQFMLPI